MTMDMLYIADAQTLLAEEPHFSSGNQYSLHAGQRKKDASWKPDMR